MREGLIRVTTLNNGEIGLKVSIDNPYIQIMRRLGAEKPYILWRTRYKTSIIEAINQDTKKMQDLLIAIKTCCDYELYSIEDFHEYSRRIKNMDTGNIKIGEMYGNEHRWIEVYEDTNGDKIPCACFFADKLTNIDGRPLITIKQGLETEKNAYFVLNIDTKYIFLEVFKIFAAISDDNKQFIMRQLDEFIKTLTPIQNLRY